MSRQRVKPKAAAKPAAPRDLIDRLAMKSASITKRANPHALQPGGIQGPSMSDNIMAGDSTNIPKQPFAPMPPQQWPPAGVAEAKIGPPISPQTAPAPDAGPESQPGLLDGIGNWMYRNPLFASAGTGLGALALYRYLNSGNDDEKEDEGLI